MLDFFGAIVSLLLIVGYVLNFIKIFGHTGDWGIEMVLRIIGIFVPYMGAILGFIN